MGAVPASPAMAPMASPPSSSSTLLPNSTSCATSRQGVAAAGAPAPFEAPQRASTMPATSPGASITATHSGAWLS